MRWSIDHVTVLTLTQTFHFFMLAQVRILHSFALTEMSYLQDLGREGTGFRNNIYILVIPNRRGCSYFR